MPKRIYLFVQSALIAVLFAGFTLNSFTTDNNSPDNSRQIKNLRAFAKLYGYVRFFHPSDEASSLDWDKFASYGVKKVLDQKNDEDLKEALKKLFLPVAPTAQIYSSKEKPGDIRDILPKDTAGLKVTSWQHSGVWLSDRSNIYRSVRLNVKNVQVSLNSAPGIFLQSIDAKEFRGKEIKLKAYVKMNVSGVGNQGQLWMRVDRENKQFGFFDNMQDRPITASSWSEYEISGSVANDATEIYFGGFLLGAGQMWVDDFRLLYKNANSEWIPIAVKNSGFEDVNENNLPKDWKPTVQGYTYLVQQQDAKEGSKCFLIKKDALMKVPKKIFDKEAKAGEIIDNEITEGIRCRIPLTLYCDSTGTLGKNGNYSYSNLVSDIDKTVSGQLKADNVSVRLGDVIISWNVLQHFYPYFDVVKTDWDKVLTETLSEALGNKTADEFYNTLRKMIAKLHDGHGVVYYKAEQAIGSLPIKVEYIEDNLVITASRDSLFRKGDVIKSIDGRSGQEILTNAEQYVSGSPQLKRFRALNEVCDGPMGSIALVKVIRDNNPVSIEYKRKQKEGNLFFNPITEFSFPAFKKLDNEIYYINLSSVTKKEVFDSLQQLTKAKGIIFDTRWSGSDRNVKDPFQPHEIIPYLMDIEFYSAHMDVPNVIYPDRKDMMFSENHWTIQPMQPRIKAKIVMINEPSVVSYGESFMGIFENYKLAEFVGEPTAGTNGNANFITLPGGFQIMWTGMKVTKHDGSQHHLIGIKPTYPVRKTIKAVCEGRDEYLEKAVEVIKKNIQ